VEVEENLLRRYKAIPGRLRPQDVMVGHTGYLIFARNVEPGAFPEPSSRRRAQLLDEQEEEPSPTS
jgi:hypothetical protein